jgi:hypothetical protein
MVTVSSAEELVYRDSQFLADAVVQSNVNRGDGGGQSTATFKVLASVCACRCNSESAMPV